MEATTSRERQRARAIAEEYRSRGYKVIEQPSPEQLPEFLVGYHPDVLVQRGDEAIIVEVKSRSSLIKDPRIKELARLVQAEPHWNFELVVVGEEDPLSAPEGAAPFERDDILRGIEAAERLLASEFSEAALLQAWSTLEATVRLLSEKEGLVLERLNPLSILTQATSNGVISRDDYNFLTKVMKYRNALAHGFKTIDFDPVLVTELINITKRLLQSTSAP
jgi:REase_AHJR-like